MTFIADLASTTQYVYLAFRWQTSSIKKVTDTQWTRTKISVSKSMFSKGLTRLFDYDFGGEATCRTLWTGSFHFFYRFLVKRTKNKIISCPLCLFSVWKILILPENDSWFFLFLVKWPKTNKKKWNKPDWTIFKPVLSQRALELKQS